MGEELVVRLVEFVESASPVVWAAARQQVMVRLFQNILGLLFFSSLIVGCVFLLRLSRRKLREAAYEDEVPWVIAIAVSVICPVFFGTIAFFCAHDIVGFLLNPDYYAIEILLELFK